MAQCRGALPSTNLTLQRKICDLFIWIWKQIKKMEFRVLELFSGIGGMHFAFTSAALPGTVVAAMDINTHANAVYAHNFPTTSVCNNNIQSLTPNKIKKMNVNMILMSPPCQPHTRVGNRLDIADNRSDALQHICNLLPQCSGIEYVLMENVKGFESSLAHGHLLQALRLAGYNWREFILSPIQLGIPNSRNRYYCLARKKDFCFDGKHILEEIPTELKGSISNVITISSLLESEASIAPEHNLPDKILSKRVWLMDIVNDEAKKTMCFTKGYTHYSEGTGSVYTPLGKKDMDTIFEKVKELESNGDTEEIRLKLLKSLRLRYFTPREVARLMSFPNTFEFPEETTNRQKYRLLGNSINVFVVSVLLKILCS
ncbi:PREDICTED: tRNA (cytosine(38)-C(5))-methyltransferase [Rhagoletis zephyria]|uniref:tRNA (cytosine(38)-C(5))-methyltransferase n=1 Tax=Rhagoletis zephyria TaxID=28612 RepID=UPI000811A2FB|nr:PREDICTED: tRNA (cytosine(38)-C(5))-methyltransferase [Rhagoletis zephyria]